MNLGWMSSKVERCRWTWGPTDGIDPIWATGGTDGRKWTELQGLWDSDEDLTCLLSESLKGGIKIVGLKKALIAQNHPNLTEDIHLQIQEAKWTPVRINFKKKKSTPSHIKIKPLKDKGEMTHELLKRTDASDNWRLRWNRGEPEKGRAARGQTVNHNVC